MYPGSHCFLFLESSVCHWPISRTLYILNCMRTRNIPVQTFEYCACRWIAIGLIKIPLANNLNFPLKNVSLRFSAVWDLINTSFSHRVLSSLPFFFFPLALLISSSITTMPDQVSLPCFHWLLGNCPRRDACGLVHHPNERGSCLSKYETSQKVADVRKQNYCRHWIRGKCTRQDCSFRHDPAKKAQAVILWTMLHM